MAQLGSSSCSVPVHGCGRRELYASTSILSVSVFSNHPTKSLCDRQAIPYSNGLWVLGSHSRPRFTASCMIDCAFLVIPNSPAALKVLAVYSHLSHPGASSHLSQTTEEEAGQQMTKALQLGEEHSWIFWWVGLQSQGWQSCRRRVSHQRSWAWPLPPSLPRHST